LGGIGKTQTAVEYAYRFRNDYHAILWLQAETHDQLVADVVSVAALLDVPEKSEQNQQCVLEGVKRWLNTHENWLLIVDNVEDMKVIQDVLPCGGGCTLLTTRAQSTGTFATCIALEQMGLEEGALFLLRRAKLIVPDVLLEECAPHEYDVAKEISSFMDGLPLALDQAGAYIEETRCSVVDYRDHYNHQRAWLLALRGASSTDHPQSVAATLSLSFEHVKRFNPVATDLLRFCAFLHPDAIPEEMCFKGIVHMNLALQGRAANSITLDTAIAALRTLSLLRRHIETKTVSIHRLVQAVVKDAMDEEVQRQWVERVVLVVNSVFPTLQSDVQDLHHWAQYQNYLSHALVAVQLIDRWHLTFFEANQFLYKMGLYFLAHAEYAQAEMLLQKARENHVQVLGETHSDVAESFNALGDLFYSQGKYEQAEAFLQKALKIREQVEDATHPDIASNLSKLARLYQEQGKYRQAEPLLQRAVAIHEQNGGSGHPDVADVLNSLGFLYRRQGKLTQAEPLLQRALSIYKQNLGPEHPDVLFSLTYLASLFYDQGKYEQAEDYYLCTLSMREHVMGLDHPHVATSLNDVARVFRVQGKYAQAELLFQRAIAIYTKTVGASLYGD
jgi:tetratricopeptide (TPR) repeat protein